MGGCQRSGGDLREARGGKERAGREKKVEKHVERSSLSGVDS